MSPKTKDGGWFLDDESASIGYDPYPKAERPKKSAEKKTEKKEK